MPTESAATPALDDAGHLTDAVSCTECDYNLRGLSPNATCPECGHPIDESIRFWQSQSLLTAAQRRWLTQTKRGVDMLLFWPLAMALAWVLFIVASPRHDDLATVLIGALIYVYAGGAVWFAATPRLDNTPSVRRIVAGWVPRVTVIVATLDGMHDVLFGWRLWPEFVSWLIVLVLMIAVPLHLHAIAEFLNRKILQLAFVGCVVGVVGLWLLDVVRGNSLVTPDVFFVLPVIWIATARLSYLIAIRLRR